MEFVAANFLKPELQQKIELYFDGQPLYESNESEEESEEEKKDVQDSPRIKSNVFQKSPNSNIPSRDKEQVIQEYEKIMTEPRGSKTLKKLNEHIDSKYQ